MRSLLILLRWPVRGWLHRRCLVRIARLERELFPYWQHDYVDAVDGYPEGLELKPGARWLVNSHNDVQIFRDPFSKQFVKKEWLDDGTVETTLLGELERRHEMAKIGVLYSAEMRRALYYGTGRV